jgi:hypothetical protein
VATIKPMANPIDVSRRCAVTPSGTPIIAKATHANGNENRLFISVRLAHVPACFRFLTARQLLDRQRGTAWPFFSFKALRD